MNPPTSPGLDLGRIKVLYDFAEQRYLRSLPPEHFMEATAQATQREITLASFAQVHVYRPDVQYFNELLVQFPKPGQDPDKPGQVVPDNMVLIHPKPIKAEGSFNTPLQPVGPFLMLEYVSKYNRRKDYDVNYDRYQNELKVPYYLIFYPDADELSLFRLRDGKYVTVLPNESTRYAIPELELEVALLDRWVRYWFRGELLPLPGELLGRLNAAVSELAASREQVQTEVAARAEAEKRAEVERQARSVLEKRADELAAELARLREELARAKGQS